MTAATERIWTERVQAWRESGATADEFAEGKGFAPATLRFWASRLGRRAPAPRLVQLVPKTTQVVEPVASSLEIAIGDARVRVGRGFDRELLADVVGVLRRSAR